MKKLYEKNQLLFFFLWLLLYILSQQLCSQIPQTQISPWALKALANGAITAFLSLWIRSCGLSAYYGLRKPQVRPKEMLYYLPLAVVSSTNLWHGFRPAIPTAEVIYFLISMGTVGFLEELLFRGFLLLSLRKYGSLSAVIISAFCFSAAHLLNRGTQPDTEALLLQLFCTLCAGFMYGVVLLRSRSLWPCIASHAAVNILSGFSVRSDGILLDSVISGALMVLYGLVLWFYKHFHHSSHTY